MVSKWSSLHLFFLHACPRQGLGTRSWDSNQSIHYQIGHAELANNPWETKINMIERDILLKFFSRNPHATKERNDGKLHADPSTVATRQASSSRSHATPFKVQVNFDIPLFEGLIDADVVYKWLNLLEGYFSVHNFFDREKITFALLKVIPHVKDWWDTYSEKRVVEESAIFRGGPYMGFLLECH
jgi:hypothetical protein